MLAKQIDRDAAALYFEYDYESSEAIACLAEHFARHRLAECDRFKSLLQSMRLIMPISTHNNAEYADIQFGEHPTLAMTMLPETWNGIATAYADALKSLDD